MESRFAIAGSDIPFLLLIIVFNITLYFNEYLTAENSQRKSTQRRREFFLCILCERLLYFTVVKMVF